jgi:hypothetical protein
MDPTSSGAAGEGRFTTDAEAQRVHVLWAAFELARALETVENDR